LTDLGELFSIHRASHLLSFIWSHHTTMWRNVKGSFAFLSILLRILPFENS
jgi:hypothetical protein